MASDNEPVAKVPEAQSPPSDNDAGERPVRKQLKETSIESAPTTVHDIGNSRKRSLEETREEPVDEDGEKPRKRSRESTPDRKDVSDTIIHEPILEVSEAMKGPEQQSEPEKESKEDTAPEEDSNEDPAPEEESKEDPEPDEDSKEDPAPEEYSKEDPAPEEDSNEDPEPEKEYKEESNEALHQHERNFANLKNQDPIQSTNDTVPNAKDDESAKGLNKKRSHERLDDDHKKPVTIDATTKDTALADSSDINPTTDGEREKKRHRDNSQERETMANNGFATSAFGKAVGASPFAALGKAKESTDSTTKPASTSAFASSSLAAFSGSDSSPFGTLGASTASVFGKSTANASTNAFAAAAAKPSGLSGFASTSKPGGLTSFASGATPSILGETKPKPLGSKPLGKASNSDDDEESGDDNEDENGSTFEAAKTDERFYEQTIATGEESEKNVFTCKAKLFHFFEKEWKERGIGTFKINVRNVDGKETGRMIMRADGAGRVMLNSPIFKGMSYGDANNKPPSSKQIMLVGTEEGRTVPLLLRTSNESIAAEVYKHIDDLLQEESQV